MSDWEKLLVEDYGQNVIDFYRKEVCNDLDKFYFFYEGTSEEDPQDVFNYIYDPKTKSLFNKNFF